MGIRKFGNVVVSTGQYQDQSGKTKRRNMKIGSAFRDDQTGYISLKLELEPPFKPDEDGYPHCWLSIFLDDDEQSQSSAPKHHSSHQQKRIEQRNDDPFAQSSQIPF